MLVHDVFVNETQHVCYQSWARTATDGDYQTIGKDPVCYTGDTFHFALPHLEIDIDQILTI